MRITLLCLFLIPLFYFSFVQASEDIQAQFDVEMNTYHSNLEHKKWFEAAEAVTRAYELGNQLYKNDLAKLAELTLLTGIARNKAHLNQVEPFLNAARAYYEKVSGAERQLVQVYVELAKYRRSLSPKRNKETLELLDNAITVSKNDPLMRAEVEHEKGEMLRSYDLHSASVGHTHFKNAYKLLLEVNAQKTHLFAKTAYRLGKIEASRYKLARAESYYLESLASYQSLTQDDELEAQTTTVRMMLVRLYEAQRESEKSTPYLLEIGRYMTRFSKPNPTIVYRSVFRAPRYQHRALDVGEFEFLVDIDEEGYVRNPRLLRSRGDDRHDIKVIGALKKYRYAPVFKDGMPQYSKDIKVMFKVL